MTEQKARNQPTYVLLAAASFVVLVAGLKAAVHLLLPLMMGFFLAILGLPLVAWLRDRGLPRWLAVVLTILATLGALTALLGLLTGSVAEFTARVPLYKDRLAGVVQGLQQWLQGHGVRKAEWFSEEDIQLGAVVDLVATTFKGVAAVFSNVILVLLTMTFVLAEEAGFQAKLELALSSHRDYLGRAGKIRADVQRYLGVKTLMGLLTGALVGLCVGLLGLDFPLLWGMLAFLMHYIPNLGAFLAAIPAMLLALVQLGPGGAGLVGLAFVVIHMAVGNLLEPVLMGRRLGLSVLVVFLSLVFWGWVWGPVGMFLSVPITMIFKITLENSQRWRWVAVLLDVSSPRPKTDESA
jgi:predicted PurR-regulated permease PerM